MAETETWTTGKLLEWTKNYLSERGSDTARLDAEVLLAHAKGCQRIELYTTFDEVASDELRDRFRSLVKQRADGMPVAYLVENREFYSLPFRVSPAVLIPRPETEFLVLRLLDLAKEANSGDPLTIIDVGTGSGIVAICAAIYLPSARVIAIDISQEALEIAKGNAVTHKVDDRIEFRLGDLLDTVEEEADFVVSNPPYVSEAEYKELDPQVRDYEPKSALLAGPTGTEVIANLLGQTKTKLRNGGWILLEISPMILDQVQSEAAKNSFLSNLRVTQDIAKLPRIVELQKTNPIS